MHVRQFQPDEVIFQQGDQGAGAILVMQGSVSVMANKIQLALMEVGDFFGEIALAVIAQAVNLHPVQVIFGIIIFGSVFGILGVILAVPAIATAKIIYTNLYADILRPHQKAPH